MASLFNYIKDASPSNRIFDCAYVAIGDKDKKLVGTYVQGFYQLAQVQGLKCQIEAASFKDADTLKKANPKLYKKVYHADGQLKSPLELAIIDKIAKDDIQNEITAEYTWQNQHGVVPQEVSKYRVMPEWLSQLEAPNSKLRALGSPQRVSLTIDNYRPKPKDKALHSTMQVIGILVTLTAFVGLLVAILPTAFLASLPALGLVGVLAAGSVVGFFALKTMGLGNVINFFGVGEVLWTDIRALTSKQFLNTKKSIGWGKLAKSLVFGLVIGGLAFMGASAVFASTLALPLVAGLGIAAQIIAGFFAAVSFVTGCIGASIPVRVFSGFGIWDNTVSVAEINAAKVSPLEEEKLPKPTTIQKEEAKGDVYILASYAHTKAQRKQEKLHLLENAVKEYRPISYQDNDPSKIDYRKLR